MKVLIDSNIIVDYLANRKRFYDNAKAIFNLIAKGTIVGYVNTSSVTDIYYILRQSLSDMESRKKLKMVLNLLQVIEVTKDDCLTALNSRMSDFEDSLAEICAKKVKLNYIVTRDRAFLKRPISISPQKLLAKFKEK